MPQIKQAFAEPGVGASNNNMASQNQLASQNALNKSQNNLNDEKVVAAPPRKKKDPRLSQLDDAQIMAKLRSVVSKTDPLAIYTKIKKIGQG